VGDRPLVVVPTGALHAVPWSILPSCRDRPVTVTPSATLWATESPRDAAAGAFVAAGPGLPGARDEALAVAAVHHSAVLLDAAATVDAVLAGLDGAGIAHLAAHGRLSASNPLFSGLLLADGPLMVYDLDRLGSVPRTVVLGACDSGRSVVRVGDELLGLAAAFLARGAGQLIGPIVPVPDAQTAPLMVALHRRLVSGAAPAVALAEAQRELAATPDPAALAPAAGFICVGRRATPTG
jgi:CHAT domain-containing protein